MSAVRKLFSLSSSLKGFRRGRWALWITRRRRLSPNNIHSINYFGGASGKFLVRFLQVVARPEGRSTLFIRREQSEVKSWTISRKRCARVHRLRRRRVRMFYAWRKSLLLGIIRKIWYLKIEKEKRGRWEIRSSIVVSADTTNGKR